MTVQHIAVLNGQPFGFEPAGDFGYCAPGTVPGAGSSRLSDGRVADVLALDRCESVFATQVWRVAEAGPVPVAEADPFAGYAEQGARLVQVRSLPPLPGAWPQFPAVQVGDRRVIDAEGVRQEMLSAVAASAPQGWQAIDLECRAVVRRMEITASVTFPGGDVRAWAPPVMVGQWLHRLRVRDYTSINGTWYGLRLRLEPGKPPVQQYDPDGPPAWLAPGADPSVLTDELRLLPTRVEAIRPWLLTAVVRGQQEYRAGTLADPARRVDDGDPVIATAPVFDVVDEQGKPAWYRPMVGRREMTAVLHYLDNAPAVLSSRGHTTDLITGEPSAPMGFHTDGRYVWSSEVAHYLRHHDIPPVPGLVDHIREQRYRLPDEVPKLALIAAMSVATGMPPPDYDASEDDVLYRMITTLRTSPRFYSFGDHKDGAWCLTRDRDWWVVYRADETGPHAEHRFGDRRDAYAYLVGQLASHEAELRWGNDEEIPWWQVPYAIRGDDVPLESFTNHMATDLNEVEVDRYGDFDGNLVFPADTPADQLPPGFADRPRHRLLLRQEWTVMAMRTQAGAQAYLLPATIQYYLPSGIIRELEP